MSIKEDIKMLLAKEATTMTKMAILLTAEKNRTISVNVLSQKLRNKTIKFEEVRDIADLLGYDIKFEKRN